MNKKRTLNGRTSTYIIAEMACSHEGDPALARKIIDAAGGAGADAIQFQILRTRTHCRQSTPTTRLP